MAKAERIIFRRKTPHTDELLEAGARSSTLPGEAATDLAIRALKDAVESAESLSTKECREKKKDE